jgi:hypothetical protein
MAAVRTPQQMQTFLISQEKTIRYAQSQLSEGDLISCKSLLDGSLRQLNTPLTAELEDTRSRLLQEAH